MKTKKDFIKVAEIIKDMKKRIDDNEGTGNFFDETEFLLDEFAYWFENENKEFNETKFRQAVLGI